MERHDEFTNAIISSASKMGYSEFSERFATHDRKIRPIIAGWKSGGAITHGYTVN